MFAIKTQMKCYAIIKRCSIKDTQNSLRTDDITKKTISTEIGSTSAWEKDISNEVFYFNTLLHSSITISW